MTTSINVDKRSVKQLLETGKNKRFIIPEYQRPYAWSDEQLQVLFDDLTEYTLNTTEDENNTYFLGTIVSYENDNKEQEIIDGQQRITCLLYTSLHESRLAKENAKKVPSSINPKIPALLLVSNGEGTTFSQSEWQRYAETIASL